MAVKTKTPSITPNTEETGNQEQSVETLTGGKYKTPEDLAKGYAELEKKLGEQSDEVKQAREFMTVAQPVFDVIKDDSEIFKAIDSKLRDPNSSEKPKAETTDQDDVRKVTREMVIKSFEEKTNISKLSADKQRDLRAKIGNMITELTGTDLNAIDLRRLDSTLENAYTLVKSRTQDESTLEAINEAEKTDQASIGSIPSSGGKSGSSLSPEEAEVAEKMGLTAEEYISGKTESSKE